MYQAITAALLPGAFTDRPMGSDDAGQQARWSSAPGITSEALTAPADGAMYTSKRAGRSEPVLIILPHPNR